MNPWELINFLRSQQVEFRKRGQPLFTEQEIRDNWAAAETGAELKDEWLKQIMDLGPTPGQRAAVAANDALFGGVDNLLEAVGQKGGAEYIRNAEQQQFEPGSRLLAGMALGAPIAGLQSMAVRKALPATMGLVGRSLTNLGLGTAEGAAVGALTEGPGSRGERAMIGGAAGLAGAAGFGVLPDMIDAARPSVRAARGVQQHIRDFTPGGQPAIIQEATDAAAAGKPMMLGDMNPMLQAELDFAANNSPRVAVPLAEQLRNRQAGMTTRMGNDAERELASQSQPVAMRRAKLADEKSRWADSPDGFRGLRDANPEIDASKLARFFATDDVYRAWSLARQAGDITDATVPTALRTVFTGGSRVGAPMRSGRATSFSDLHNFRQILDDRVTTNFEKGAGNIARAYTTLRDRVDDLLEDAVPDFRRVNARYAEMSANERALLAGQRAWNGDPVEVLADLLAVNRRSAVAKAGSLPELLRVMRPSELEEFRNGAAASLLSDLRGTATNQNAAGRIINRNKPTDDMLRVVFGNRRNFQNFMRNAEREAMMAGSRRAVGQSATHARGAAAAQKNGPAEMAMIAASVPANAVAPVIAANHLRIATPQMLATELGPLLRATGPDAIRSTLTKVNRRSRPPLGRFTHTPSILSGLLAPPLVQDQ